MSELEQLNERIAQFSELVKAGSEAIKSMETALKAAKEERDRLKEQQKETEPKFERVKEGAIYYIIDFDAHRSCGVYGDMEEGHPLDEASYNNNNYFRTEKRAQEVVDKINLLLKLERLHDIFCPNYMPDFNDADATKWYLFVSVRDKKWHWEICHACVNDVLVYFSSAEIAQKVCDILNAELKEENEEKCNE